MKLRFGENLLTQRERRELSQGELAAKMTERGHAWYQSTVYKTERGEREASFTEATDLALILGCTTDRFLRMPEDVADESRVMRSAALLSSEFDKAAAAISGLHQARAGAEGVVSKFSESPHDAVRRAAAGLAADLADLTTENAGAEGDRRWRKFKAGD